MPQMKSLRVVLIILLLVIAGCNLPTSLNRSPNSPEERVTAQAQNPITPTPLPPTPTATPLPAVRLNQGDMALLLGDTPRAREEYQSAAMASEDKEIQAAALVGIARSYLEERNYPQTIETLLALINEHPTNQSLANGYYFLAEAYLAMGENQKAAEGYEMYLQLKPGILDDLIAEKATQRLFPVPTKFLLRASRFYGGPPKKPQKRGWLPDSTKKPFNLSKKPFRHPEVRIPPASKSVSVRPIRE